MSTRTPKSAKGLAQLAVLLARQCKRLCEEEGRVTMRWIITCWRSRRNGNLVGGYIYVTEGKAKVIKVEQPQEPK